MYEVSNGFGGSSGSRHTGVRLLSIADAIVSLLLTTKKLDMLSGGSPVLTAIGDNPLNPSNPFEPSVIDA
jgi:hypothetical protein